LLDSLTPKLGRSQGSTFGDWQRWGADADQMLLDGQSWASICAKYPDVHKRTLERYRKQWRESQRQ